MNRPKNAGQLIVALDFDNPAAARDMVGRLGHLGVSFKVGLELFLAGGPGLVEELAGSHRLFLDLKFHDIPNTVAGAVRRAASLGVWMTNVHAAGGKAMMEAAREALGEARDRPLLIAVTVLTSMGGRDLVDLGINSEPADVVRSWTNMARDARLDGIVCSPREIGVVKNADRNLLTVTPGIRPRGSDVGDQVRVETPAAAMGAGGDFLVVGRPITRSGDPETAAAAILDEMGVLS